MASEPNPTFARRRLAVRLRALREQNDRSLSDLAEHLKVSLAQASRLDTGARGFKDAHVDRLADWYGVRGAERELLAGLAVESQKRAWWQQVELPDSYRTLIGMEKAAESINEYCAAAIPGLIQTPEYAAAAAASSGLDIAADHVSRAVDIRMRRQQELLQRKPRPFISVIIDELALARIAGGPEVMALQLAHLLEAASAPQTTVQVVGFEAGLHIGTMLGQTIWLEMGGDVPDVLYQDDRPPSDTDDMIVVAEHRRKWQLLSALALDLQASRVRVESYLSRYRAAGPRD